MENFDLNAFRKKAENIEKECRELTEELVSNFGRIIFVQDEAFQKDFLVILGRSGPIIQLTPFGLVDIQGERSPYWFHSLRSVKRCNFDDFYKILEIIRKKDIATYEKILRACFLEVFFTDLNRKRKTNATAD